MFDEKRPITSPPRILSLILRPTAAITSSPMSKPKVSLITARLLTRSDQKSRRLVVAFGTFDDSGNGFRQSDTIELAGEFVTVAAEQQALFFEIALVDDAENAARPFRFAISAKPDAALIFEA